MIRRIHNDSDGTYGIQVGVTRVNRCQQDVREEPIRILDSAARVDPRALLTTRAVQTRSDMVKPQ